MALGNFGSPFPIYDAIKAASESFIDMNTASGGASRGSNIGTSFTNLVSYSGKGYFAGMAVKIDSPMNTRIRLILDGTDALFGSDGILIQDLDDLYGISDAQTALISLGLLGGGTTAGFMKSHGLGLILNVFTYEPQKLIRFESTCVVQARRTSGSSTYRGGLLHIYKD